MKRSVIVIASILFILSGFSSAFASNIYVMDSENTANTDTIEDVLTNAGHTVTIGLPWHQQDGAQGLSSFDAVVFLNNFNWGRGPMSAAGQTEILNYVSGGGGIVTSEWFIWKLGSGGTAGSFPMLNPLAPVEPTTAFNGVTSTTYTQMTPNPIVNKGLPGSFSFNLGSIGGTETVFTLRKGALIFYSSSNGGGVPGSGGLVGWNFGSGRVISFSTLVGNTELADANYSQLFVNSVEWVAVTFLGDFNEDCRVDGLDFIIFRNEWGRTDCLSVGCEGDMNSDGKVDGLDFIIFRNNWGKICP